MFRNWMIMMGDLNDDLGMGHNTNLTSKYKMVNTDEFELRPKKEYIEKQIKALEEELRRTQQSKEITLQRYFEEERRIQGKIDDKKKELKKL